MIQAKGRDTWYMFFFQVIAALVCWVITSITFAYPNPQAWVGSSIDKVMRDWGTPTLNLIQTDGRHLLIYEKKTYQQSSQLYQTPVGVNVAGGRPVVVVSSPYSAGPMPSSVALVCQIEFRTNTKGIVVSVRRIGNGCI